jgi:predicted nucleotidyltransferase
MVDDASGNIRQALAQSIVTALERRCVGSRVALRGSLATDDTDRYSDIDLCWVVPDARFDQAIAQIGETLATVGPVASLRSDRQFQRSTKRRLVFVRFADVPLFWRVDLEVFAESVADDPDFDVNNSDAQGDRWSPTDSALMNALAAIKAVRRGQPAVAHGLLERGYARVGLTRDLDRGWPDQILGLTSGIAALDPSVAALADQIEELVRKELGTP